MTNESIVDNRTSTFAVVLGFLLQIPPPPPTIGSKGYVWNKLTPERAEVLRKVGDAERGKEAFRSCRGCHKQDAFGRVDGSYPRLTGQYASVIIKQLTDIRAGTRFNPKMEPFISPDAVSVEDIADIAAYLSTLTTVKENGKGPGDQVRAWRDNLHPKGVRQVSWQSR